MPGRRITIEYVRESFEKEDYILLSKEYNYHVKLDYICPKGHKHSTLWNNWRAGYRCPHCSRQSKLFSIIGIKHEFEQEDFILLTDVYVNNSAKLEYICPNGHRQCLATRTKMPLLSRCCKIRFRIYKV